MKNSFKVPKTVTKLQAGPSAKHDDDGILPPDSYGGRAGAGSKRKVNTTPATCASITSKNSGVLLLPGNEVFFTLNLFQKGYFIGSPAEVFRSLLQDGKSLRPYDTLSEILFYAMELGWLPGNILHDIPSQYAKDVLICEVRDYRKCMSQGMSVLLAAASPVVKKVYLRLSLAYVANDVPLISDDSWNYDDLLELESLILKSLHPKILLKPTPVLDRHNANTYMMLDLGNRSKRRLRQTREMNLTGNNQTNGKEVSIQMVPEASSCKEDDQGALLYEEATQCTHASMNVDSPATGTVPMDDQMILQRFVMIKAITQRYQLNLKKNKVDAYPTKKVASFFSLDAKDFTDETQNLTRYFIGGVNTCKKRELTFIRFDGTHQAIPSRAYCRLSMTEMPNSCTVSVSIQNGFTEDSQSCLRTMHTLPTSHYADLFADQYNVLMERNGYSRTEDKTRPVQFRVVSAYNIDSITPATSSYNIPPEVRHAKIAPPQPSNSSSQLCTNGITLVGSSKKFSNSVPKSTSGNSNQTLPLVQPQTVNLQPLPLHHVRRLASELLGRNATSQSIKQKMHDILSTHFQLQMLLIHEKQQQLNQMSGELMTGHGQMSIRGSSPMVPVSGLGNMKSYHINMGETSSFGAALPPGSMSVVQAVEMASKLRFVRLNMHSPEPSGIRGRTGNHNRLLQNSLGITMPSHGMNQCNINILQQNAMLPMAPPKNLSVFSSQKGKENAAKLRVKCPRTHKALNNSSDTPLKSLSCKRLRLTSDALLDVELQQSVKEPFPRNSAAILNGNDNKTSPMFEHQQLKQLPLPLVQKLASQLLGRNASLQNVNQKMNDILATNLQLQMLLLDDKQQQQNKPHGKSMTGIDPMGIRRSSPVVPSSGLGNVNSYQNNLGEAEALPPRSMSASRAVAMASKLRFVRLDMHSPGPSGVTRMTGNHNWMLQKPLPGHTLNESNINNMQQNAMSSMAPPKNIEANYFQYSLSQLQLQKQKLASHLKTVASSQRARGESSQSDVARGNEINKSGVGGHSNNASATLWTGPKV